MTENETLLDQLWSKMILAMNDDPNRCEMCEKYSAQLYAHHFITTKEELPNWRYNILNGAAICMHCHMHKMHGGGVASVTSMLNCYNSVAAHSHKLMTPNTLYRLCDRTWPEYEKVPDGLVFAKWRCIIKELYLDSKVSNALLQKVTEYENIFTSSRTTKESRPSETNPTRPSGSVGYKRDGNRQDNHKSIRSKGAANNTRARRMPKGSDPELEANGF